MTQLIRFNMPLSGELLQWIRARPEVESVKVFADSVYVYHNLTPQQKITFYNILNRLLVEDLGTV